MWLRTRTACAKLVQAIRDALQGEDRWIAGAKILFAIAVFLFELLQIPIRWLLEKLWDARRWIAFGLAIVSAAVIGAHPGWWLLDKLFTDDPCGQAHELRVVTTPDTQLVLQSEAAEFMAEQDRRGCDVTVSIHSVDSFDDLWAGFASQEGAWEPRLQRVPLVLGPHPDVVIPALTAQAEALESIETDDFTLENEGSVARSAVVLAAPTSYKLPADGGTLNSLLAMAARAELTVARPDPERSEAALLSTRALYGLAAETPTGRGERAKQEADLSPSTVRLDSAGSAFCRRDNKSVGIIVPQHVLKSFDSQQLPDSLCTGAMLTDTAHEPIPITDLPALDYPFVRVRWPGQASRERDELIGRFHTWLRDHLPDRGFEPPEQAAAAFSAAQYRQALAAHRESRREIKVLFLLDNSGSMGRNVADGRSLDRGGRLISRITDRLGSTDWAALWALPGEGRGGASEQVAGGPVDLEQKRRLGNQVAALELTTGTYSPVYAGLVHAVRQTAGSEGLTLVLITDGENRIPEGRPAEDLAFEAALAELAAAGTRLEVLAVAPEECSFEDLRKLNRRLDPSSAASCVPAAYADVDTLASEIVGRLRVGS